MSDSRMKHLNNQLIKLKSQIDKFNPSDDISKDEDDMEKIEDLIKDIEGELEEIDNEIEDDEDLKGRKPLLDKLSEQKNELSVLKNNFNKKKDEARSAHSKELLKQGKLTGVERKKAQRDMAIDQVKEVDEQGLMLDSVHDYVKGANKDLENMNVEEKDAPNTNLNLSVYYSYEAVEGMTVTIYSGKIIASSSDDGINAAGGSEGDDPGPGPHPGPWPWNSSEHLRFSRKNIRQEPEPGPGPHPGPRPGPKGNASYYISIYSGEIYVFCDGDGIDSNGNIFIHGGKITVFSQGNRDNEPIDHDGNFTLFNGEVLGVGSRGMEKTHLGIKKGNEMYAFYDKDITKNKFLKIVNDKGDIIREEYINKDINYIFYSSLNLNEKYSFYLKEENIESKLNITFGKPQEGVDDEDKKEEGSDNENYGKYLQNSFIAMILIMVLI